MKHIISCGLALSAICSMQAMEVNKELSSLQCTLIQYAMEKKGKDALLKEIEEGSKVPLSETETALYVMPGLCIQETFKKPKKNAKDLESNIARDIFNAIERKKEKLQAEKTDAADFFVGENPLLEDNIQYDLENSKKVVTIKAQFDASHKNALLKLVEAYSSEKKKKK